MAFDLAAYFARIGYDGDATPTAGTLRALHFAHATTIPFENLDIHLGKPIRIDIDSVVAKLVDARRGGYCFEHNTLFAEALRRTGFTVRTLGARVGQGDPRLLRRTHMILAVDAEATTYLCDVGFGAGCLLKPIPLRDGAEARQGDLEFRVERTDFGFALIDAEGELYHFTLEELYPADFQIANHFTSTSPESGFVRTLTAQRNGPHERWILQGRTLERLAGEQITERTVAEDELLDVLAEIFDLHLPPGTTFGSPAGV